MRVCISIQMANGRKDGSKHEFPMICVDLSLNQSFFLGIMAHYGPTLIHWQLTGHFARPDFSHSAKLGVPEKLALGLAVVAIFDPGRSTQQKRTKDVEKNGFCGSIFLWIGFAGSNGLRTFVCLQARQKQELCRTSLLALICTTRNGSELIPK